MKNIKASLSISKVKIGWILIASILTSFCFSCKKFVDIPSPTTSTNSDIVYSDDTRAAAVLTNLLANISNSNSQNDGGVGSISVIGDLSADNLNYLGTNSNFYSQYFQNSISPLYTSIEGKLSLWQKIYPMVYITNASLEGLKKSSTLTPIIKDRLMGEAYFLRAYFYFYLVNFFGDVPLVLSTDYKINSTLPRAPQNVVYDQILSDLSNATQMLSENYLGPDLKTITTERVRPNKAAAIALLARVHLYLKHYSEAEAAATQVISYGVYSTNIPLNAVFQKNSKETIWALQSVHSALNTFEGDLFMLPASGPDNSFHPLCMSSDLFSSFESGDQRKNFWTGSVSVGLKNYPFPSKYKVSSGSGASTEYPIVLRLSEQFLIRAEARNELGDLAGAQSDLNVTRTRSGLANSNANTQNDLRTSIFNERRVELFTEWGHRWLDLKRSGSLDKVMGPIAIGKSGVPWSSFKALYPVPQTDILFNKNLTQNTGYSN